MSAALNIQSPPYLDADAKLFRASFDNRPFAFRHRLASHPLFELPRLYELVREMSKIPDEVYFDAGEVRVDQRWDQVPLSQMSVTEAMQRIETAGAWIIVRHAERDPAYGRLLDECMAEAEALAGRKFRQEMERQHAIIFIT